jgi:hypothetical protein
MSAERNRPDDRTGRRRSNEKSIFERFDLDNDVVEDGDLETKPNSPVFAELKIDPSRKPTLLRVLFGDEINVGDNPDDAS